MTGKPSVFVIGSGAAGAAAARSLVAGGAAVTLAEPGRVGGSCLWFACMPKKALYNAAHSARALTRAEQFGLTMQGPGYDWPSVLAWKWHAQETYAGDQEALLTSRGVRLVKSPARFVGPGRVAVGNQVLDPDAIVVATGSEPVRPPIPGAELADVSSDAMGYESPPERLVIIGGGYVGLEFAGIYSAFGTEVTIVLRGASALAKFDPEIVDITLRALARQGVRFVTEASIKAIEGAPGSFTVAYDDAERRAHVLPCDRVLLATGRRPSLASLDLAASGIALDEHGAPVLDDALRSSDPRVYFAGDVAGRVQLTPAANAHGETVARSILTGTPVPVDLRALATAVFTVPQLGQVGMTEEDARRAGIEPIVRRSTYEYVGAAVISDERDGLVKLVFDPSDVLIGAQVASPYASDLIYALALAVRARMNAAEIRATRAVHPSYAEALNWAAW
jgi:pyruvate/2-oxoglutarate dehydrogenase complex dihydrolipoamide dehydrogenase (E3) component